MKEHNSNEKDATATSDDREVIRLRRRSRPSTSPERPELVPTAGTSQRTMRVTRPRERRFEAGAEDDTLHATQRAIEPRTGLERTWRTIRRIAVGNPISSERTDEQRLPKRKALAVFSSDALSSSAYATDEILITLSIAGSAAFVYALPLAGAIAALLVVVAISYRQTIRAYPGGGGAYIVARENLGQGSGLIAAAALAVDYVLTVAVSIAAGVLAIVSAFPKLAPEAVPLAVVFIWLITLANLRGIRESGTLFAIPTYGFILCFGGLIVFGLIRAIADPGLQAEVPASAHTATAGALGLFLVLRAFASGCTALTGIEAISNGIPSFEKPESRNASTTLMMMAAILVSLFLGITLLARLLEVQPTHDVSVPAQIARTVLGESPLFYVIQAFTALILILAANTAYADFPRLASILARDRYLPHQFTFRGDRLAFSNGILVLGFAASALVVLFEADVTRLIPLYAFGVFVSFTLSQSGMIRHWWRLREPGWRGSILINGVGGALTAVVAVIVGSTKFGHGAWISMVAMAVLALIFWSISRHYASVERRLRITDAGIRNQRRLSGLVVVPVDAINLATLETVAYAHSLSPSAVAVHVTDDAAAGARFKAEWETLVHDVPLVVIESPFRSFVAPMLSYLDVLASPASGRMISVVIPEYRTGLPGTGWLHNQSARRLKRALLDRPGTGIIELPYRV